MKKQIEIEDIVKYVIPGNLEYSPDGKALYFDALSSDKEKNVYHHAVWLIRDGKAMQLTQTLDASPVLWDDNTHIILKRTTDEKNKGKTELFSIDINGGEARPWFTLNFPMTAMKKLSDGSYAVTGFIDSNDPDAYLDDDKTRQDKLDAKKKNLDSDYQVVDEVPYWFNGSNFTNKRRSALFILSPKDKKPVVRVTAPSFDVESWETDGTKIYYTGNVFTRSQSLYSKLYSYDAKTKKRETLYGKNGMSIGSPFIMNKKLYVSATDMKKYGVNETRNIYEVENGQLKLVYKPELSMYNSVLGDTVEANGRLEVSRDKKHFLTLITDENHTQIAEFDSSFRKKIIWNNPGMVADETSNGEKITFIYQDWAHVAEVFEMDKDGKNVKQLTNLNTEQLKDKYVAKPIPLTFHYEDENEKDDITGWVLLPQDFKKTKKYPAVLDVHGGPRCVYGETFFHEMQAWVSKGYVVMFTNMRGSDGRGDAYADIRDKYGDIDFKELMTFVDEVLKKYPNIDKKKLCETGGSYGGFMTNWIITHTDRFCCAASQRSIANWISMAFMADIGLYFNPDQCGGKSPFDFDLEWKHSPLKYAQNCHTPTLFIHSDQDRRCPLPEGMQMMQALTYQNVETRMVIFHGENHELSRSGLPQHRLRRLNEITNWFEKHIGR